jgi:hypothetical protein
MLLPQKRQRCSFASFNRKLRNNTPMHTCRPHDGSLGVHAAAEELSAPPKAVKPTGQRKQRHLPLPLPEGLKTMLLL